MTDMLRDAIARIDNEPETNKQCVDWDKKIQSEQDMDLDIDQAERDEWDAAWGWQQESGGLWQENWNNGNSW